MSRQAGWISPVVVHSGVVAATWQLEGDMVVVAWFEDAGQIHPRALDDEVVRLGGILGRDLGVTVTTPAA